MHHSRASKTIPRICIVTPGALGSNPRVVKEADALHAAGYGVTVIATRMLNRVDERDNALLKRIKWKVKRIDLRFKLMWLPRRGQQLAARYAYEATGGLALATLGFSPFTSALSKAAKRTPADIYIAHYPAALPAAAKAARKHGARYAYDAEDYHLGDWPENRTYETDRKMVRDIEGSHLPHCAYVTAASPGIADAYAEVYEIQRPKVILNAFPLKQGPAAPTARGSANPGPSIYWFSQTIGPDRGLELAVRAIGAARMRPHLYLRGTPAVGFLDRLLALAAEVGAGDRLHILDPASPDEMGHLAAAYDIGLVSEQENTAARRLCLTNKLFTFLLAGTAPVLSATRAHRAFAAEADLNDSLYCSHDAPALAALIDRLLESPERLANARAHAWRLARRSYHWELECGGLVSTVSGALLSDRARESRRQLDVTRQ